MCTKRFHGNSSDSCRDISGTAASMAQKGSTNTARLWTGLPRPRRRQSYEKSTARCTCLPAEDETIPCLITPGWPPMAKPCFDNHFYPLKTTGGGYQSELEHFVLCFLFMSYFLVSFFHCTVLSKKNLQHENLHAKYKLVTVCSFCIPSHRISSC